jgi:hypothetical protein
MSPDTLSICLKTYNQEGVDYVIVGLTVDHTSLADFSYYAIDLAELIRSLNQSGEFFILTCWCGVPECVGIGQGVLVRQEENQIHWQISAPFPHNEYVFSRDAVQNALAVLKKDIKRFVAERIYSDKTPYHVVPRDNEAYFHLS